MYGKFDPFITRQLIKQELSMLTCIVQTENENRFITRKKRKKILFSLHYLL